MHIDRPSQPRTSPSQSLSVGGGSHLPVNIANASPWNRQGKMRGSGVVFGQLHGGSLERVAHRFSVCLDLLVE
jgi:hypothetical protein